jgi:AGCS family alanine or glycine:cation symporter
MFDHFFAFLNKVDEIYWHIGMLMVLVPGVYFTIKTNFFQFKTFFKFTKCVRDLQECGKSNDHGVSPLRLYFASVGGMIGLGNIVGVVTAVLIGGPGALFWLWIASFSGMLIKYMEIYLGIKYRQKNKDGCYDGGPMYYLGRAFKNRYIPYVMAVLLCIYGVEILQFTVITDTLEKTFHINRFVAIGSLLLITFWTAIGGIKRLANICSLLMPIFIVSYVGMCLWVIFSHADSLIPYFKVVFESAFTGHAAVGCFAGSSFIIAAQQGIARGVYSGDIGIGFDSTIQAATKSHHPERQARMAIFSLATDSLVCTMSILVVLVTDLWKTSTCMLPSEYVATALSMYIKHADIFMGLLFFLAGFTTIIAYYSVGLKCARFVSEKYGPYVYAGYALIAFTFFSFFDQTKAQLVMSITSGLLLTLNVTGMFKLRKEIKFS